MKRLGILTALALLAQAAAASATFHGMRVNEVMLSHGGNASAQFIELQDPTSESFPPSEEPYRVIGYDGAGARVGQVTLSAAMLQAKGTTPILISSSAADQALSTTGDVALTFALPSNGQACFTSGPDGPDGSVNRVFCVGWGCLTRPLNGNFGADRAAAPPDSQSVQLTPSSSPRTWKLGTPTPKTANTAATSAEACPSAGPADSRKPVVRVVVPSRPRLKALIAGAFKVGVSADEQGTVVVDMSVDRKTARRLKHPRRVIADASAARTPASLKLKVMTKKLARQLKRLKRLRVKITVSVVDAAGNAGLATKTITLQR